MTVDSKDIVIVGGGFSGSILALQLLRYAPRVLSAAVVDKGELPGRGLAYGTNHDCHLLNVHANDMSALPEEPDHFLNWAKRNYDRVVGPQSFLPRATYGRYLASLLEATQAKEIKPAGNNLAWIRDTALAIEKKADGFVIHLQSGIALMAPIVVLALGNFPPGHVGVEGIESRRVFSAWSKDSLSELSDDEDVLLIGSGLTAVDVSLALQANGFRGKIHILSRRGLVPLSHKQSSRWPQFWNERSPRTVLGLSRLIRSEVALAASAGVDWRAVIDSLRPSIQKIWQSFSMDERRRLLRHARPYWEVHRHRLAPEVARTFSELIERGQVEINAGRIVGCREDSAAIELSFRKRGSSESRSLRVTRVINCSGSETNFRRIGDRLLTSLFEQKLVRQDQLALGLDVDENGALLDSAGRASQRLFAIGPILKGRLWESTAVPELRVQAAKLARRLLNEKLHCSRSSSRSAELTAVL